MKILLRAAFLTAMMVAPAAPAAAQDPLAFVLQADPGAVGLAGSPRNLASLVAGLTAGTPVRLLAPGPAGFNRVVSFVPRERLSAAQAAARLEQLGRDFDLLGVARPSPEQLSAALAGGSVRTGLEPDLRQPTPEEQAVAQLPADIRSLVRDLPPKQALRTVELADQQLIALGSPYPTSEQRRQMVERVRYGVGYVSASAGETTFPPLSPLVAAPLWQP